MGSAIGGRYARERSLLRTVYFLFYLAVFGSMILSHRLLFQVQPVLWNFNRDLSELALLATGLPRWMVGHPWSFGLFDLLLFVMPAAWLATALRRPDSVWYPLLGWVFVLFLALYLLIADIFWQVHHEPFILYLLLPLVLLTRRPGRFDLLLRGCRYYFLYVFISAALWKIARGGVFNPEEMSRILLVHHADLLSGDCVRWTCRIYSWLIDHPFVAQSLYLGGVVVEAVFVVGLFTRRWDRWLIGFAVLFVVADWLVMQIPYWTLLLGGVTLWLDTRPRERAILVYETTHHENLPALLDLCVLRFPRVTVFLKEVSFANLSGGLSPAVRWPSAEFVAQGADESNRRFIGRLSRSLREQRYSHLHLATLDNNLLLWALQLWVAPAVQVSMTVHEVNEYFARPLRSLRDWTETLAKPLLRRRVRHYHFFLPAMAKSFLERMPGAKPVFLPSRFYDAPAPGAGGTASVASGGARPFTIVIPGSVDANRRDYEPLLEVFRHWSPGAGSVQVVLLGDSSSGFGRHLVAQLRLVAKVRAYEGYVPETIYEQEIRDADLLWSPLRVHKTGSRDNPEVYGQTTASGLTADILLNNIPALAPVELVLPDPFNVALLPYRNADEAADHLHRLTADPADYNGLRQSIHGAFTILVAGNFAAAFDNLTALDEEGEKGRADAVEPVHPYLQ